MDEPVDSSPNPDNTPGAEVLDQELRRVAGIRRLLRRHVTALTGSRFVEPVPAGPVRGDLGRHARIVTVGLVLCHFDACGYANLLSRFIFVRDIQHAKYLVDGDYCEA
jgi:hypothetical protein